MLVQCLARNRAQNICQQAVQQQVDGIGTQEQQGVIQSATLRQQLNGQDALNVLLQQQAFENEFQNDVARLTMQQQQQQQLMYQQMQQQTFNNEFQNDVALLTMQQQMQPAQQYMVLSCHALMCFSVQPVESGGYFGYPAVGLIPGGIAQPQQVITHVSAGIPVAPVVPCLNVGVVVNKKGKVKYAGFF